VDYVLKSAVEKKRSVIGRSTHKKVVEGKGPSFVKGEKLKKGRSPCHIFGVGKGLKNVGKVG